MAESIYILGDEDRRKFARLIAAAWSDGALRDRYESEPRSVLAEFGIDYPAHAPTPPLPPRPEGDFEITRLEPAAGAEDGTTFGTGSTLPPAAPYRDREPGGPR
ncbi:hypothetical protein Misp01_09710 [Microtetraspora sp. NBRC 13810]|uniref:TIGR04351 family putative TOMM peptide n=1 Tax=Microtetraspora sp. NBRC 13810 TaxID=3030990 RepID=UPI0024A3D32C|nr:TIGR04351 family putative TOMM peptide [Microtetraspora sp. NBRC 13810]GLW05841.1 hypothetical protein Misp01_09710 [Microtetraspora sp. NBRC 13810]